MIARDGDEEAREHEDRPLGERRQVLRLAVAVLVAACRRAAPATPTAKNVSSAATRSVPECSASERSPRLPVARPVAELQRDQRDRRDRPRRARCGAAASCTKARRNPSRRGYAVPLKRGREHDSPKARPIAQRRRREPRSGNEAGGRSYRLPRSACSRSIASKSALKLPVAEAARAVPLDHLEEQRRPVLRRLREDLQQVAVVVAVGEDPEPLQVAVVLVDLADAVRRRPRSTCRACRGRARRGPSAPRRSATMSSTASAMCCTPGPS